jgi:hypothetical protein
VLAPVLLLSRAVAQQSREAMMAEHSRSGWLRQASSYGTAGVGPLPCLDACVLERARATDRLGNRSIKLSGGARAPFHSERVIRWLQFNPRDQPERAGVHQRFQVERLGKVQDARWRITRKRGSCALASSFRNARVRAIIASLEAGLNRVDEELTVPLNRDFQVSWTKSRRLINDARVRSQFPLLCLACC